MRMRFNVFRFFRTIRLSTQLFALVAVSLLIAMGLIAYAMRQVQSTQGTLKHTIDNRMVSGRAIQGVVDALSLSLEPTMNGRGASMVSVNVCVALASGPMPFLTVSVTVCAPASLPSGLTRSSAHPAGPGR